MTKYKKFFIKAKEENLEALELTIRKSSNFSFSFFNNEIDSYKMSDSFKISARGIYNGKIGTAESEKFDKNTVDYIISRIKENAMLLDSEDKPFIFKGSKSYKKKNVFNKKLAITTAQEKLQKIKSLDIKVKSASDLILNVETQYHEQAQEYTILNSYGLKLTSKTNYALVYSSATANDEMGETKVGFAYRFISDLDNLNQEEFAKEVVEKTISQFGSAPCASGKYKCVFSPSATSSLLEALLSNVSAEQVQKKSSLLADKLEQKVCSSKVTVTESPLKKNPFFRYFDDEGVATYDKTLIKNGVLKTYAYNLQTAYKDQVQSTGNGYKSRGKIGIELVNVAMKPGRLNKEQLIEKLGKGIYIDDISGVHSGLHPESGNFSLIASGFMIENGKKDKPVSLITVAGNIFDVFNDVIAVGNDLNLQFNGYEVPSILIKKIAVSGK
ncbi:MAG TPA: metallopeptidase TldD-related protein [Erysipelotrichaceae bacterium]|nr:metallopeptidase TldD-related protein [Erysipelotrichaceae bacterium]HQA84454.1 metallopeptidase TldD-related protein [Erysipelotrichaceae bacterium]